MVMTPLIFEPSRWTNVSSVARSAVVTTIRVGGSHYPVLNFQVFDDCIISFSVARAKSSNRGWMNRFMEEIGKYLTNRKMAYE